MSTRKVIHFNQPHMTGKELFYIAQAHVGSMLAGDGPFTKKCHAWLEEQTGAAKALLTHSCTAALELSALLLNIQPGDEIIMPSFTFVSTANAFVLRGGIPVFIDIRPDTLNIDERLIEKHITKKTRAIVPVHYAGVACEMDTIQSLAKAHSLHVVEDAAQGMMSKYKGRALGTLSDLGCISFHETKNLISGEGGCLLVNRPELIERAEILREKGTDRSQFMRGAIDKYTWRDIGSSFLPGELIAAFLWAQFEEANRITRTRKESWEIYHRSLKNLETRGCIQRPHIPNTCDHNAHMYYVLLGEQYDRTQVLTELREHKIDAFFHYVPLHNSPAGLKFSRTPSAMTVTDAASKRLIRLPMWVGLEPEQQEEVVQVLTQILTRAG